MLFKNANLLYALFALIIPIIVHLFQLRRFKKVAFTNVAMLKKLELQTRKSAVLKKWLVLLSRIGFFAMLIFAFSQPYFPNKNNGKKQETLLFIDNSFSMQASGEKGQLLNSSIQEVLENITDNSAFLSNTIDKKYKKQQGDALKKTIQNIEYSPKLFNLNNVLLQGNQQLNKAKNNIKNFIIISDFQKNNLDSITAFNKDINYFLIPKKAENQHNISIGKVTIHNGDNNNYTIDVAINNQSDTKTNRTIAIESKKQLLAKNTVILPANKTISVPFSIQKKDSINAVIRINDNSLQFDNEYYFSISNTSKTQLLLIGKNTNYLKRIYTNDEFKTAQTTYNSIDYSTFSQYDIIVLDALENFTTLLKKNISTFIKNGGTALIIPNNNYKTNGQLESLIGTITPSNDSLFVTKINYTHPILKNTFIKETANFDYPYSTKSFLVKNSNSILSYTNGSSFISEKTIGKGKLYFVAAALDKNFSNFKNSALIVPVFYNIAKYNSKTSNQQLVIGTKNDINIATRIGKDEVLTINKDGNTFIPQQQIANNKVRISTLEKPEKAGIYSVKVQEKFIKNIAYNYNRKENSNLFYKLQKYENKHIKVMPSFENSFLEIQQNEQINALWKWFLLAAIAFILLEILLIKYLK